MRKFNFTILVSLLLIVSFNSCTKSTDKPQSLAGKIKTVKFAGSNGPDVTEPYTQQVFYNDNGTIAKYTYTYSNSQLGSTTTYHYSAGKIVANTEIVYPDSVSTISDEYYLGPGGTIDSTVEKNSSFDNIFISKLSYNGQELSEIKNYVLSPGDGPPGTLATTDSYTYNNGNMVKYVSSAQSTIVTYEYSGHANNINRAAGSNRFIDNSNLPSKMFFQSQANPVPVLVHGVNYTFDTNDRVAVETTLVYSQGVETGQILTRTFTYY